jgi:hypothetical protein
MFLEMDDATWEAFVRDKMHDHMVGDEQEELDSYFAHPAHRTFGIELNGVCRCFAGIIPMEDHVWWSLMWKDTKTSRRLAYMLYREVVIQYRKPILCTIADHSLYTNHRLEIQDGIFMIGRDYGRHNKTNG